MWANKHVLGFLFHEAPIFLNLGIAFQSFICYGKEKNHQEALVFAKLFYLILVLLILNLAPEVNGDLWNLSPGIAFAYGLSLYFATLGLIYIQARALRRYLGEPILFALSNLELIAFLFFYHFFLSAARVYSFSSETLIALPSLLYYFGGLFFFHSICFRSRDSWNQIRFLAPFVIPFLLISLAYDLLNVIPSIGLQGLLHGDSLWHSLLTFACSSLFIVLILTLLPAIIVKFWRCEPIDDPVLLARLERLCQKAHFTYASMGIWTIMNNSLTAAIIGIVSRFRYIMFTKSLIREMSPDHIEAILAHEIGHSYRKHLLIYPFIIMGMMACSGLFFLFFGQSIYTFIALKQFAYPASSWSTLHPVAIFLPYAVIIAVYFRIVFGFFSRNFERQADLHVFHLGLDPQHLIDAFDYIATISGNKHKEPSWHHYSIQERMDFIDAARSQPELIEKHHRRVRRIVPAYFGVLILAFSLLFSPFIPQAEPYLRPISQASSWISTQITYSVKDEIAEKYIKKYQLKGKKEKLQKAIARSLDEYGAMSIPGVLEFYAAQILLGDKEIQASAILMTRSWNTFAFEHAKANVRDDFALITARIILAMGSKKAYSGEREDLLKAMESAS
jgi:Zn-dependent protease with chaperone function